MVTPSSAKSFTLRVTTVRLCSNAVAAIMPSGTLSGRPSDWRSPSSSPHRAAIGCVTGRTRPGKRSVRWRSSACCSRARREASCMVAKPDSSSPILTTLRNNVSISCAATQLFTLGSGRARINSEGILVSRRNPFTTGLQTGSLKDCGGTSAQFLRR